MRLIEPDKEINEAYEERDVAGVAIINGAIIFKADFFRQLSISIKLDCIRFANYRGLVSRCRSQKSLIRSALT